MAKSKVQRGSDNVFKDLGIPHPEEALLKADLLVLITRRIRSLDLSQTRSRSGVGHPPAEADLVRGKLRGFSLERLLAFLMRLGNDVEISIHERPGRGRLGHLRLSA